MISCHSEAPTRKLHLKISKAQFKFSSSCSTAKFNNSTTPYMSISIKTYGAVNLWMLVVMVWIYSVDGGMMEDMMKSMMGGEQKGKKIAIPIPIPVFIKETGGSQPQPQPVVVMEKTKKSKDWIWKMMMLKMMKGNKEKGCQSKTIVFPSKNKSCCGMMKMMEMMKMMTETTTPPPEEEEPEYPDDYTPDPGAFFGPLPAF